MNAVGTILTIVGAVGGFFVFVVVPIWALRRHNRMYLKNQDRISGDPEAAQATRRFETMWTFFAGRDGGGL